MFPCAFGLSSGYVRVLLFHDVIKAIQFSLFGLTLETRKLPFPSSRAVPRRVFDSFSLVSRPTFVALSFVFCLFLVRSSFGLR